MDLLNLRPPQPILIRKELQRLSMVKVPKGKHRTRSPQFRATTAALLVAVESRK